MDKQLKLSLRIIASLYPDRKPSDVRKIIDDALAKPENHDDIKLWDMMTQENAEHDKQETVTKKVVEEHHYHHYDYTYPWYKSTWVSGTDITLCNSDIASDSRITTGDTFSISL